MSPVGVVVMAYGTPTSLDDVEGYYTHIRRGRPPTPEQLIELQDRYRAIGGISPLLVITRAQADRLALALGDGHVVALGQKHAAPFIEDAVRDLAGAGCSRLVGVVLAPHYSRGSVGEYAARLSEAAAAHGLAASTIDRWHDLPEWRAFQADSVRSALAALPARTQVVFTAHSLPERVLVDDPYPDELHESAAAIAELAGVARWEQAWQSAGRTPDPWRGPDILAVLAELAANDACEGVLVCPQGFTADHLEVLYDLDIQAAERALELGMTFARTKSINADQAVLAALARRVATT
ncbi:MAG: ferrochelatase [Acidimicrobiales bacterium]